MKSFDKARYDQEYNRTNIITKRVPFNRTVQEDVELLTFADEHGNFTRYVKDLIRQDLENTK